MYVRTIASPTFISYARKTSRAHAQALQQALGGAAFLDVADLEDGSRFPEEIVDALLGAKVVVVFADETYFQRWYCLWELRTALAPFLALGSERTEAEKSAALAPIILALPPDDRTPAELERLPPQLRNTQWPRAHETDRLAALVHAQLGKVLASVGERLEAAGKSRTQMRAELLDVAALPPPANLAGYRIYPLEIGTSLGASFFGRADELWRIDFTLYSLPGTASGAALTGALEGGGGVGKTRLALEYVHRFGRNYPGGIFWVDADVSEHRLEEQFHGILTIFDPGVPDLQAFREEKRDAAKELTRALHERGARERILYVVDNLPEASPGTAPKPLSTWCPALGKVALLVTSRARLLGTEPVHSLHVGALSPEAAVEFLTEKLNRSVLDDREWKEMAEWVGHLPLALMLLNRTMQAGAMTPQSILTKVRSSGPVAELEQYMDALRGQVPPGHLRGVAEVLSLSYDKLSEAAQRAARVIAHLAPVPIPEELVKALGEEVLPLKVRTELAARSFVTPVKQSWGATWGSMHRVLADYLRSRALEPSKEWELVCQALEEVMKISNAQDPRTWPTLWACVPHVEWTLEHRPLAVEPWVTIEQSLKLALGFFFTTTGMVSRARPILEHALERARKSLGEEHQYTLVTRGYLAFALQMQGDLDDARAHHERTLEGMQRVLMQEHPAMLGVRANLAATLRAQEELAGARALEEMVLDDRRRRLGEEHPDTLKAYGNLASTLRAQGDLASARAIEEMVLERMDRILGKEHPDTLTALGNLALTLLAQGDVAGARMLGEKVLKVSQRVLGEDHPDMVVLLNNLGATLLKQGDLTGARALVEKALETSLRVLGEEHPDTLTARLNLATTLRAQGDDAGAKAQDDKVREMKRRRARTR